jgi:hypothetical protein
MYRLQQNVPKKKKNIAIPNTNSKDGGRKNRNNIAPKDPTVPGIFFESKPVYRKVITNKSSFL